MKNLHSLRLKIIPIESLISIGGLALIGLVISFSPLTAHADTVSCSSSGGLATGAGDYGLVGYDYEGGGTFGQQLATQFTLASTCDVSNITIPLGNVGSPTYNAIAAIYTDDSGVPGSPICTSTAFPGVTSSIASSTASITCSLSSGTYWLVIGGDSVGSGYDTSNYYKWGQDADTTSTNAARNYSEEWINTPDTNLFLYEIDEEATGTTPTTTPSSTVYVDNPTADLFYGFIIFMSTMWFFVWFFRKK